jgi:hypothetical protein
MYIPPNVDDDICYNISVEYANTTASRLTWGVNFAEAIDEAINTLALNKINEIKSIMVEVEEDPTYGGMY